tara:strand:+ start:4805 stop:5149 length:345 start_codon:yes stop_codon:yes gene_type:complete
MEINLDSYEITKAIKMYLKARGVNWEDEYPEMYIRNYEDDLVNLNAYKTDEHFDEDERKFIIDAKYNVEGLFVKRKKEGQKKYEYVPFDYRHIRTYIEIGEDSLSKLEIYEGEE